MNFLFCSHNPLDLRLGAPKALMETAAALESLGHHCRLASDEEISPGIQNFSGTQKMRRFSEALASFLSTHAKNFDVVEYEHLYLPYERSLFSKNTLLVARSVLLTHHFQKIILPRHRRLRSWIGHAIKGRARAEELRQAIDSADLTLQNCDLIKVNNGDDRIELISRHLNAEKIVVIPDGISTERLAKFERVPSLPIPSVPRIAFVGTFDVRKGAREFPEIVREVTKILPNCKFKLLGSRYLGEKAILNFFPKALHKSLEIVSEFDPDQLPTLLQDCTLGIFPSYIEGFGIGVLEMLAASLPVIAYDSPGPPMMLPKKWLVQRGNHHELVRKVLELIQHPQELANARVWSKARAQNFTWEAAAKEIAATYAKHLEKKRND